MRTETLLLNFLCKYLFIFRAASDGWTISYIGGNQFEFYNKISNIQKMLSKYKYNNKMLSK